MNDNDQDLGASDQQNFDNTDSGDQNVDAGNVDASADQDGQQTANGDAELAKYRAEVKRLNRALIEARRGSRQQSQNQGQDTSAFETPEGQYGMALQIATANLSRKLENVYDLYPEVPASEIKRIRMNPWAFASLESYQAGDVETALQEVEQALLDRAEEIASEKGNGAANAQNPAQINPNQQAEQSVDAEAGSAEDESPWTMPMDKLEKKARKELAKKTA